MALEIERKFLVVDDSWRNTATGTYYRQGYLSSNPDRSVRIRIAGDEAWLTVKGGPSGAARAEYEYPIPANDAREMLDTLCERPLIEKTRYELEYRGMLWEIDEFGGDNEGLIIAEVELDSADQEPELPAWAGEDVTGDTRYYNASLVKLPYSRW